MNPVIRHLPIFLDSGVKTFFIPLWSESRIKTKTGKTEVELGKDGNIQYETNCNPVPESLKKALKENLELERIGAVPSEMKRYFDERIRHKWLKVPNKPYIRYRFGQKIWQAKDSITDVVYGIWIKVETNTGRQDQNQSIDLGVSAFDRGSWFNRRRVLTDEERGVIRDLFHASKKPVYPKGSNYSFIQLKAGESEFFELQIPRGVDPENENNTIAPQFDPSKLKFAIDVINPNGQVRDVDIVIDFGNTRLAVLLIECLDEANLSPDEIRKYVKALRLYPNPVSGEFDDMMDDVSAGIVSSSIVFHAQDLQEYYSPINPNMRQSASDPPNPSPCDPMDEYHDLGVKTVTSYSMKHPLGKKEEVVTGYADQRIPQMFTAASPVILGERADREFNRPSTKRLIERGARVHQASAKIYVNMDGENSTVDMNMLLNEEDPAYREDGEGEIPKIQGMVFEFVRDDGSIINPSDLMNDAAGRPNPFPTAPRYPRHSTFAWTLLYILEQAAAQMNSTFSRNGECIPHRLRHVIVPHPAWTKDETEKYYEKCREGIALYNYLNIYNEKDRLSLAEKNLVPDEAVACQIPFVFNSIMRSSGMSAAKWIQLFGKKRRNRETGEYEFSLRIASLDIGGGTSDYTSCEYRAPSDRNHLTAAVLYKDCRRRAGDDLEKAIIERWRIPQLTEGVQADKMTEAAQKVVSYFSQTMPDQARELVRSRLVKNCLIPMAIYCLSKSGEKSVEFTPHDAGVGANNWAELVETVLGAGYETGLKKYRFHFAADDMKAEVEKIFKSLFRTCACNVSAFDVDLIVFGGKTTENVHVKNLAKRIIPIADGRMLFANDLDSGGWYPFVDDKGRVSEAKSITAVGSAIFFLIASGKISNWKITRENLRIPSEWGSLNRMAEHDPEGVFLTKDQDERTVNVTTPLIIARRNLCAAAEPVYMLCRKDNSASGEDEPLSVTFRRVVDEHDASEEALIVTEIDGVPFEKTNYQLKIWTCPDMTFSFWQDTGRFDNLLF